MFYQMLYFNRFSNETSRLSVVVAVGYIAFNACKFTSKAVIKQTLTSLSILLICSYSSNPSISGIIISRISKSYKSTLKLFKANRGSLNVSTCSNPLSVKAFFRAIVISVSSSIIRILFQNGSFSGTGTVMISVEKFPVPSKNFVVYKASFYQLHTIYI